MVLSTPGDITITREQVHEWVTEWSESDKEQSIDDFIRAKVQELGLPTVVLKAVDGDRVQEHDVADLIIDDLGSYGVERPGS